MSKAVISVDPRQSALQRRRQLTREHVSDLVRNNSSDEEIRAALTPEHVEWARVLIPFIQEDLAGGNTDDTKGPVPLFDAVSAYCALALVMASPENQEAFISVSVSLLSNEPASLVVPAIWEICKERVRPYEFVPTVMDRIEGKSAALRQELAVVEKIVSLDAGSEA